MTSLNLLGLITSFVREGHRAVLKTPFGKRGRRFAPARAVPIPMPAHRANPLVTNALVRSEIRALATLTSQENGCLVPCSFRTFGIRVRRYFIAISCLFLASAAVAEPTPMSGDAIKDALPGSRLVLDTPLGTKIPIRFTGDGMMTGEAGELASVLGAAKDRGRWWVDGGRLCYKWFRWFDAESRCVSVRQDGSRIYWTQDDGESGTATLIQPQSVKVAEKTPPPRPAPAFASASASAQVSIDAPPAPVAPPAKVAALATAVPSSSGQQSQSEAGTPAADPRHQFDARYRPSMKPAPVNESIIPKNRPAKAHADVAVAKASDANVPDRKTSEQKLPVLKQHPVPVKKQTPASKPRHHHQPAAAASPAPKAPPAPPRAVARAGAPSFRVHRVDEFDVLNVRSGPSEYYRAVGTIPPRARGIKVVGQCTQGWCPISLRNVSGWVNSFYLAEDLPNLASSRSAQD